MPNIGAVLREEIARLSKKGSRALFDATRKTTTQHRRDIATLKRQVAALERQIKRLVRHSPGASGTTVQRVSATNVRFVAKGLRSQRDRLALSAADFGKLMGVSAQSIYKWESEKTRPRPAQIAKLAQLRGIGKREARARVG